MKNINIKYSIDTKIDGPIITQSIVDELLEQRFTTIINTRDEETKKALVELGWTPPKGKKLLEEFLSLNFNAVYFVNELISIINEHGPVLINVTGLQNTSVDKRD